MSFKSLALVLALVAVGSAFRLPSEYPAEEYENNRMDYMGDELGDFVVAYSPEEGDLSAIYPPQAYADHDVVQRHKRSPQFNVGVGAEHNRRQGTDLNVNANGRIWQSNNGRSTLDGNANYNRHYGGQFGTGRPNYGAGVTFRHNF